MTEPTAKSTAETITAENGKISRGKYTFATRLMFAVSELTEKRSADAKKFHARSPVYANTGYGTPTLIGATRMNTTENRMVLMTGMNTAQPKPITVCL